MKKVSIILLAAIAAAPLAASAQTVISQAQAASPANTSNATATNSDCSISGSDIASIQAIQNNPNLSPSIELTQELTIRKQLLGNTITCAINEAQQLQQTLNALQPANGSAMIQSRLSGKIDDAVNFYNLEDGKLADAGINATEAIAKEVLAWRESSYAPLESQVNNFILWDENQGLFATAGARLNQTQQIVSFIESAVSSNDIAAKLGATQSSLQNAENQNIAAKNALAQFLPPDQSLALIQQSLQSLADTYQKFTDLNNLIQTVLPTSQ
jgi:hypothetical protein